MQTGNLVRVMAGEEFSSTDLHLANGDTLLVGQVAELKQVDASDLSAATRLHHRKLQVRSWLFPCPKGRLFLDARTVGVLASLRRDVT
jgi:hypothetical protein